VLYGKFEKCILKDAKYDLLRDFLKRIKLQRNSIKKDIHGKDGFLEIPKKKTKYRSENNFVGITKYLCMIQAGY